jgi:hypothetical protein
MSPPSTLGPWAPTVWSPESNFYESDAYVYRSILGAVERPFFFRAPATTVLVELSVYYDKTTTSSPVSVSSWLNGQSAGLLVTGTSTCANGFADVSDPGITNKVKEENREKWRRKKRRRKEEEEEEEEEEAEAEMKKEEEEDRKRKKDE